MTDRSIQVRIIDVDASLKRIAWAYGCAKKGSSEEQMLLVLLLEKVQRTRAQGAPEAT